MLEAKESLWCSIISPLKILLDSLTILHTNKLLFTCIILFTTLPLSFLIFTITISTNTLRSHIYHLESMALFVPTRMEARHAWHESRDDAVSLLRTRAIFSLPCFPLSLAAAVSTVHATLSAVDGNPATVRSAASAVMCSWKRSAATAVVGYVILLAFAPVPRVLAAPILSPEARFVVLAIGSGFEVYLMTVLSMGFTVSIAEERFGLEAIRVGWDLLKGRRFCGWALSGMLVLVSGLINRRVGFLLNGQDSTVATVEIGVWDKTLLICSYGLVVNLSYVITTVFYCDGRRRHGIREPEPQHGDEIDAL